MNNYKINTSYAKALLLLARDIDKLDRVADDMRLVGSVMAENHELAVVFANPVIKQDKKQAIVRDLFAEHVCEATMAFLLFVVRKNRSVYLRGISDSYLQMYRDETPS